MAAVRHRSGHCDRGTETNAGHASETEYRVMDVSTRGHMGIEYASAGPDSTADLLALRRQRLLQQLSELDLGLYDGKLMCVISAFSPS